MNDIQIFNNPDFGEIRTVIIDGEPWFVSKDISDKLGYAKPANMVKLVDEDDKRNLRGSDLEPGSKAQISAVNESGLYAAIFGSKQENAKKFKKWVTSEVLPSIRKTGEYKQNDFPPNHTGADSAFGARKCGVESESRRDSSRSQSLKRRYAGIPQRYQRHPERTPQESD